MPFVTVTEFFLTTAEIETGSEVARADHLRNWIDRGYFQISPLLALMPPTIGKTTASTPSAISSGIPTSTRISSPFAARFRQDPQYDPQSPSTLCRGRFTEGPCATLESLRPGEVGGVASAGDTLRSREF
jgi:hypothetical protein